MNSNLEPFGIIMSNKFDTNSTLLQRSRDEEEGLTRFPKPGSSGIDSINYTLTSDSKLHRLILKYCIFLLFFMSLLAVGLAILKKRFRPRKTQPWSTFRLRKARRRQNFRNTTSVPIPSISIISSNSSCNTSPHQEPCLPLNYYYSEPRRLLWESFYGTSVPHQTVLNSSSNVNLVNSILSRSGFQVLPVRADADVEAKVSSNGHLDTLTEQPPPNYEDVFAGRNNGAVLELPTYEEAVLFRQSTKP